MDEKEFQKRILIYNQDMIIYNQNKKTREDERRAEQEQLNNLKRLFNKAFNLN